MDVAKTLSNITNSIQLSVDREGPSSNGSACRTLLTSTPQQVARSFPAWRTSTNRSDCIELWSEVTVATSTVLPLRTALKQWTWVCTSCLSIGWSLSLTAYDSSQSTWSLPVNQQVLLLLECNMLRTSIVPLSSMILTCQHQLQVVQDLAVVVGNSNQASQLITPAVQI